MAKYNVVVSKYGSIEVEAGSLDEAYDNAKDMEDDVDWFHDIDILSAERLDEYES